MGSPAVSVLIAAYNAAPFVSEAVESVLHQSLQDFEVLVVDDGSSDGTRQVIDGLKDSRIRVWSQENKGKAAALNFMLSQARGRFLAIQDADDASHPARLEMLVARLVADTDLAAVFSGHCLIVDGRLAAPRAGSKSLRECKDDIDAYRMPAHDPTMVCRADVARELMFDTSLQIGQQFDFILRLGERHPMEVVGEPLYHYRIHGGSATHSRAELRAACVRRIVNRARIRRGLAALDDGQFDKVHGSPAAGWSNNLINHFTDSVYLQRQSGNWRGAAATALMSVRQCPPSLSSLKPIVYALSPRPVVEMIRHRRKKAGPSAIRGDIVAR